VQQGAATQQQALPQRPQQQLGAQQHHASTQQQQQLQLQQLQPSQQQPGKEPDASLQQFSVFSNPLAVNSSPASTQQPARDARQPAYLQETAQTAAASPKHVETAAGQDQQTDAPVDPARNGNVIAVPHAPSSPAAALAASHSLPSSPLKHSSLLATKTLRFEVQPAAEFLQHAEQQHDGVIDYNGHDQEQEAAAARQQYVYNQVRRACNRILKTGTATWPLTALLLYYMC
jgi:hypothetical protein